MSGHNNATRSLDLALLTGCRGSLFQLFHLKVTECAGILLAVSPVAWFLLHMQESLDPVLPSLAVTVIQYSALVGSFVRDLHAGQTQLVRYVAAKHLHHLDTEQKIILFVKNSLKYIYRTSLSP